MSIDAFEAKAESPEVKFARALKLMTYSELDALAARICEIATDDNGEPNDERYIATALLDHADDLIAQAT